MDSGRFRGNRQLGGGHSVARWPDESDNDMAGEDWDDWRDRSWRARGYDQDQAYGSVSGSEDWLYHAESGTAGDPASFDVGDYRDRLLSGPGAELYGVSRGRDGELEGRFDEPREGFVAFGERSLDPEPPEQSIPGFPRQASQEPEPSSGLVRPYFRTRGRTRPTYDLAIEALVQTSERGRFTGSVRVPEHRSICDLCLDTRSVAEVAALLRLPLGVVRVLVGDVAGLGLVLVHTASAASGDRPSIEFMERVLSGLRRV
ncbi:DUF742 domain-containing protein [Amycolatopsis cihanbeyliensis]|uniref:Uncharacterized protein DUF742 n=1 Tax=Amycolatopsis cihanbeyliensis TaxID=1128664 RepID=A0A542DIK4_AMYCI|nr:DUF742 domain-containing protein [Amycolatopsis cihanbeyliensis]TQJ02929.1 uncharacterized protein DUF742 [Amycolatopsis cihanbeyliensis]